MAKKWLGYLAAAGFAGLIVQTHNDSPESVPKASESLRAGVTPILSDLVGAGGDAVLILRDEVSRQGINPTAILVAPDVESTRDANGIEGVDDTGGGTLGG
jgi:hypothetical protein